MPNWAKFQSRQLCIRVSTFTLTRLNHIYKQTLYLFIQHLFSALYTTKYALMRYL